MPRKDAHRVEAQHVVEAAERQPRADAHAQLHDLPLVVVRGHPHPELVVQAVVVERVTLGVLGGQALGRVRGVGEGRGVPDVVGVGGVELWVVLAVFNVREVQGTYGGQLPDRRSRGRK